MEAILESIRLSQTKLIEKASKINFKRNLFNEINWNLKCIWILGERWVWKTTLMLQKIKEYWNWIYLLWDLEMVKNKWLFNIISYIYKEFDEKLFFIDEIHEYNNWQREIKNIIDSFPDIKLVFSWSSSLKLKEKWWDLSRRVMFYKLWPLNFQEYLLLKHNLEVDKISFNELITNYKKISFKISNKIKIQYFKDFLLKWQYPYSQELSKEEFYYLLQNTLKKIVFNDIPMFLNVETSTLLKLQNVLYFISQTSPSNLNYTNLSKKIWVDPKQISIFLEIAKEIWIVNLVSKNEQLTNKLKKERKIFLWNSNILSMYNFFEWKDTNIWNLRETFFVDVLRRISESEIILPNENDFVFNVKWKSYIFEIWWKNKSSLNKNCFVVKDDILIWSENIIPLWLFGLIN